MKKFEYNWDILNTYSGIVAHSELMDKRGMEGWEMVTVLAVNLFGSEELRIYWKRELTKPDQNG